MTLATDVKTKLQQMHEGKAKAQAKGAKRTGKKGFGTAVVEALEQLGQTLRERLVVACKQDEATLLLAIHEVEKARDDRVAACKGERKEKKKRSIQANFARPLAIMRAVSRGENVDKILSAKSMSEMYAFASRQGTGGVARGTKPYNEVQYAKWNKGINRIIGKVPGKKAKDAEIGKFDKELARLEQHFFATLQALQKVETLTSIPVKAIMSMARRQGKHVRAVALAA